MDAAFFEIAAKTRPCPIDVVSIRDFSLRPEGAGDAAIILERPDITLYCLDDRTRRAVFVETPPAVDLARHPFYYQAQHENARRALTVSYQTLAELAEQLAGRAGGRDFNLIPIYSTGRCGSTLVSKVFERLDGVASLSEPDIFTQLDGMRARDRGRDRELTWLIEACIRLLNKPAGGRQRTLALKFRSSSIAIADLVFAAFPGSKALFLYRNAEDWARSAARAFDALPAVAVARKWLPAMERCLELREQGMPIFALSYETLTGTPESAVRDILEYCGLPADGVKSAMGAFGEDSQAGSVLSRSSLRSKNFDLTEADRSDLRRILRERPMIGHPDFAMPTEPMARQLT